MFESIGELEKPVDCCISAKSSSAWWWGSWKNIL